MGNLRRTKKEEKDIWQVIDQKTDFIYWWKSTKRENTKCYESRLSLMRFDPCLKSKQPVVPFLFGLQHGMWLQLLPVECTLQARFDLFQGCSFLRTRVLDMDALSSYLLQADGFNLTHRLSFGEDKVSHCNHLLCLLNLILCIISLETTIASATSASRSSRDFSS